MLDQRLALGVGYQLDAPSSPDPGLKIPPRSESTGENELTLFGGDAQNPDKNRFVSEVASMTASYRKAQGRWCFGHRGKGAGRYADFIPLSSGLIFSNSLSTAVHFPQVLRQETSGISIGRRPHRRRATRSTSPREAPGLWRFDQREKGTVSACGSARHTAGHW